MFHLVRHPYIHCHCSDKQVWPLNSTEAMLAPAAANETLARIAAAVGPEAASQLAVSSNNQVAYCSINLEQACSTGFSRCVCCDWSIPAIILQ